MAVQKTNHTYSLPLAIFAFFALCFAVHPFSPLRTGQLADPDDYMRLNEVLNWLQGPQGILGGWYDLSMPRMAPDAHTIIHWSRLVDMPIALLMLPLTCFVEIHKAALVASFFVPLFLFAVLLALLPKMAAQLTNGKNAQWACALVLFAPAMCFNFTPGRVDHHAYQILIAGFGLYSLPRLLHETSGWRCAVAAAFTFTCGLWIGTEAMPWLGLFLVLLSLMAAANGGVALRNAAVFGSCLAAFTTIALFLALPRSQFSDHALSWFSTADVVLADLSAGVLLVLWVLSTRTSNKALRVTLALALGGSALLFFALLVPEILSGPFADYDTFNATTALDNITEAQPLAHALRINFTMPATILNAFMVFITKLFLPFLALGVCLLHLHQSRDRVQQLWLAQFVFLLAALLLTLFWQVRVGTFMQIFTIAPLTWLLHRAWQACDHLQAPRLYTAKMAVFMVLGPLPVILVPSLADSTTMFRDVIFFPAGRSASSCNLKPAAEFLDEKYGNQNLTIMTGMNEGSELLFRTPYNVIGGNYDVSANPDILAFFNARDDETAQSLLRKWRAKLVLTCRNISPFLAGIDRPRIGRNAFLHTASDGKLHLTSSLQNPALIEKLVNNKAPNWLKEIEIPGNGDYLLFEVRG